MYSSLRGVVLRIGILGLVLSTVSIDAWAEVSYRSVALSGMQAPGTDPGTTYAAFLLDPVINVDGKVAFHGFLSGPNISGQNNNGLWFSSPGESSLAVRAGDQAPGLDLGVVYGSIGVPNINSAGEVAFVSALAGPGVLSANNSGIWAQDSRTMRLVARKGESIPGPTSGEVYTGFNSLVFNDDGRTAFIGNLQVPGDVTSSRRGIWSESAGSLNPVAIQGQLPPGVGAGVEYDSLSGLVMNGSGQTAFVSQLLYPPAPDNYGQGIWSEGPGTLSLVALRGELAVESEPNNTLSGVGQPAINDAGDTAFVGVIDRYQLDDNGIWVHDGDSVRTIVQSGDPVQDSDYGLKFAGFPSSLDGSNVVINSSGQTAFFGTTAWNRYGSMTGIWREDQGQIKSIAAMGDPAPGASYFEVFGFEYGQTSGYFPVMNEAGQIAFMTEVLNFNRPDLAREGLWATGPSDELELIALVGEPFDVNEDPLIEDLRTVSTIGFVKGSGGEDGRPNSFNDAGQLVFRLGFTEGSSGIFVATVPEPMTAGVLTIGAVCFLRRRR